MSKFPSGVPIAGSAFALFYAVLNQTIVAAALPAISQDLGGIKQLAWPMTAYVCAAAVAIPLSSSATRSTGAGGILLLGLCILCLGSVLASMSQSTLQITLFRFFQGIGGGTTIAASTGLFISGVHVNGRVSRFGQTSMIFMLAALSGPLLGGIIADYLSWRWLFLLNAPIGLLLIGYLIWSHPYFRILQAPNRIDPWESAIFAVAVVSYFTFLLLVSSFPAASLPLVTVCLGLALTMTVVFLVLELRASAPLMPRMLFRNRFVGAVVAVSFLSGSWLYATMLLIPIFFQVVLSTSMSVGGAFLTPAIFGIVLGAVLSVVIAAKVGNVLSLLFVVNAICCSVALILLSTVDDYSRYTQTGLHILVLGAGTGGMLAISSLSIRRELGETARESVQLWLMFFRLLGGMTGLAILETVINIRVLSKLNEAAPRSSIASNEPPSTPQSREDSVGEYVGEFPVDQTLVHPGNQSLWSPSVADAIRETFFGVVSDAFLALALLPLLAACLTPLLRKRKRTL